MEPDVHRTDSHVSVSKRTPGPLGSCLEAPDTRAKTYVPLHGPQCSSRANQGQILSNLIILSPNARAGIMDDVEEAGASWAVMVAAVDGDVPWRWGASCSGTGGC
jgi:hypothetical protein